MDWFTKALSVSTSLPLIVRVRSIDCYPFNLLLANELQRALLVIVANLQSIINLFYEIQENH